jgi:hypothetical protein
MLRPFLYLDKKVNPIAEIERLLFSDITETQTEELIIGEDVKIVTMGASLQKKAQDWAFKKHRISICKSIGYRRKYMTKVSYLKCLVVKKCFMLVIV